MASDYEILTLDADQTILEEAGSKLKRLLQNMEDVKVFYSKVPGVSGITINGALPVHKSPEIESAFIQISFAIHGDKSDGYVLCFLSAQAVLQRPGTPRRREDLFYQKKLDFDSNIHDFKVSDIIKLCDKQLNSIERTLKKVLSK